MILASSASYVPSTTTFLSFVTAVESTIAWLTVIMFPTAVLRLATSVSPLRPAPPATERSRSTAPRTWRRSWETTLWMNAHTWRSRRLPNVLWRVAARSCTHRVLRCAPSVIPSFALHTDSLIPTTASARLASWSRLRCLLSSLRECRCRRLEIRHRRSLCLRVFVWSSLLYVSRDRASIWSAYRDWSLCL